MPFYIAIMRHPSGDGWNRHREAHGVYLRKLVAGGKLRASGPLTDAGLRTGFLIFQAADRAEVLALIDEDPFAVNGLIVALEIYNWNPLFGAFASEASGAAPG